MGTLHTEVERKYSTDDDADLPAVTHLLASLDGGRRVDLASVVDGDVAQHELTATYFDTEDLRLAAAGLTLRRRTGGDDAGWHLKLPSGVDARTEVRLPLGRATKTVPAALRRMVRARTLDAPLTPVVTITTQRQVRRLLDATGQVLVELADDRVTAQRLLPLDGGGTAADSPTTWREVELELVGGTADLLDTLDAALRDRGLRTFPSASKLRRALGDAVPTAQPPGEDGGPRLKRKSPAGQVVLAYLRAQVDQVHRMDLPVRVDAPDAVHQMRVATRRMRSALSTFRPLFDRTVTDPLRDELKWLAGELGRARDAEVMRDRLRASAEADGPPADGTEPSDAVHTELDRAYRTAHDAVLAELDSDRYHALLAALRDLVADPPFTDRASRPAKKVLTKRVRRSWSRLRDVMATADAASPGSEQDAALHEARKDAKRTRYAAEAVAPAFGSDAAAFAAAAEALQDILGEHQDTVVTRQRLVELAADTTVSEAFALGRLHAAEEARAERLRDDAADVWATARRKRLRRWLS